MPKKQLVSAASTPLKLALDQNETIQDTVEQSAAELVVINAVLKQKVPGHVQTGEVAVALQKTDELETRIQQSALELAHVNQALKQEITERTALEQELAATQAKLVQAQSEPCSASKKAVLSQSPIQ